MLLAYGPGLSSPCCSPPGEESCPGLAALPAKFCSSADCTCCGVNKGCDCSAAEVPSTKRPWFCCEPDCCCEPYCGPAPEPYCCCPLPYTGDFGPPCEPKLVGLPMLFVLLLAFWLAFK